MKRTPPLVFVLPLIILCLLRIEDVMATGCTPTGSHIDEDYVGLSHA